MRALLAHVGSRVSALVGALVVAAALAGCASSDEKALSTAQTAEAALASGTLAWQQYVAMRTLPTTATTTLQDMLKAISDAEAELAELPATDDHRTLDALHAVREADDAVASALSTVDTDGSPLGISDLLTAAKHDLEFAIGALQ